MDTLREQLRTLRRVVDAFPLGAKSCVEYSLENEIRKTVERITSVNARLLMLKAQDKQRKLPQDMTPLESCELAEVCLKFEEEAAAAVLRKLAWKNSVEASVIHNIIAGVGSDGQGISSDCYQTTVKRLDQLVSLNNHLRVVLKEQWDTTQQIIATKQELQQRLKDYKELLVEEERQWQERAVSQDSENMKLKKRLEKRLEKLNMIRVLIVNLLTTSNVDYMQHPEWTNLLIQMQGLLSLESFRPSDPKTQ